MRINVSHHSSSKVFHNIFLNTFSAKASGKLIISGEHAVIHGAPALAMAVNRFCTVDVALSVGTETALGSVCHFADCISEVTFDFLNLKQRQTFVVSQLQSLQERLQLQYQNFLQGKCCCCEILATPYLLAVYAYMVFATHLIGEENAVRFELGQSGKLRLGPNASSNLSASLNFCISSDIPMGCGMGSSAALIVALGQALSACAVAAGNEINRFTMFTPETFLSLARHIESLQHGYSSGLDLHLACHGGGVWFVAGECVARILPPLSLRLINTGRRQSSTSECVARANLSFKKGGARLIDDFTAITSAIDLAWQQHNLFEVSSGIRENHKLLCGLGVVPTKVQNFIAALERRQMAAKVSGAGAVTGDSAGVVLVIGEGEIDDLVEKYGYEFLLI